MKLFSLIVLTVCLNLVGCSSQSQQKVVAGDPADAGISRLAKSDIDEVVELHQRAVMHNLQELMLKLYRRNPNSRHDKDQRTIEESVNLVFSYPHDRGYEQWQAMKPTDIVRIALDATYQGEDRVLPLIIGLRTMLMAAYDNHTEFFYLTSINEQKLYNSARNIEIAAWMLADKRDLQGRLLLLSDSLEDEQRNLSFQRLFGEMIATQDNLAEIISHKSGRIIKTVVVKAASLIFLPI